MMTYLYQLQSVVTPKRKTSRKPVIECFRYERFCGLSYKKRFEYVDYADDICLFACSQSRTENKYQENQRFFSICINQQNIEGVEKLVYLKSIISANGGIKFDVKRRTSTTNSAFSVLSEIWIYNYINTSIKLPLYRANIMLCNGTSYPRMTDEWP